MRARLRRSIDARLAADGTIMLLRGPGQGDLLLDGDGPRLGDLLARLDGTRDEARLARETGTSAAELAATLSALEDAAVIDDGDVYAAALDDTAAARFDRQLDVFADQLGTADAAAAAQLRLAGATVCLLGLGGLGSWVAWALASAGIGRIVGVDGDVIEQSNLNRQILFAADDVGRRKADAAGDALRRFAPALEFVPLHLQLESATDARLVMEGADVVVSTVDQPAHLAEHWVQEAAFAAGLPLLCMSQHPPFVRLGPLYVPGRTGCLCCQEAAWRHEWEHFAAAESATQLRAPSSTFGPACGVAGTLGAAEVVALLTGTHEPATLGAEQLLDMATMTVERRAVPRAADCSRCGSPTES